MEFINFSTFLPFKVFQKKSPQLLRDFLFYHLKYNFPHEELTLRMASTWLAEIYNYFFIALKVPLG